MSTLSRKKIRLFADEATRTSDKMIDVYTNATPELWVGNDVQFEIGLGRSSAIITDISNIASLTVDVKSSSDRDGVPVMTKTLSAADLADITQEQWDAKTHQHALVTFTAAETNLAVGSDNEETYWLAVSVITNDDPGRSITVQCTLLKVVEDGTGSAGVAQVNTNPYYSKAEADARYVQKHADQASWQFHDGCWYGYCIDDDKWYPVVIKLVDSAPVLALGAGETL